MPFGIALVACSPMNNLFACSAGVIIGCFYPSVINESFRYIATVLSIMAIRWIIEDLNIIKRHTVFNMLLSVLPLFATGLVMSFTGSKTDSSLLIAYLIETLICAAATYFFTQTTQTLSSNSGIHSLSQQELASIILSFYILLLAFTNISISGLSLGRILAILTVLFCAYFGSVSGGTISGVAAGVLISLQNLSVSHITGAYALGGLISGIFSPLGKLAVSLSFILSNLILSFQSSNPAGSLTSAYEIFAASLIFMLVPKKYASKLKLIFSNGMSQKHFESLKKNLIMKLDFSAQAVLSISSSVDKVASKMKLSNITDFENIHQKVAVSVCKNCGIKNMCWNKDYDKTNRLFKKISEKSKDGKIIDEDDFPESFRKKCPRLYRITGLIKQEYDKYHENINASQRIAEIRSVVSSQYYTMSNILSDISENVKDFGQFYPKQSEMITKLLKNSGINVKTAICRSDLQNHIIVETEVYGIVSHSDFTPDLINDIEYICGCKLDTPLINTTNELTRVQLCQRANYEVSYAVKQHICQKQTLCGDSFKSFNDAQGHIVFILSDGMGSGAKAAVDAAMACGISEKLIKAGLRHKSVLNIVNSSISVKSTDESFATLDLIIIDLFSGLVKIYKAGAAPSFAKKDNRVLRFENPGLPLGILNEISVTKDETELDDGDCILMVSDGITAFGDKWIEKKLRSWEDLSEKEFCEQVVTEAKLRRNNAHDDDMSCIAIRIFKKEDTLTSSVS